MWSNPGSGVLRDGVRGSRAFSSPRPHCRPFLTQHHCQRPAAHASPREKTSMSSSNSMARPPMQQRTPSVVAGLIHDDSAILLLRARDYAASKARVESKQAAPMPSACSITRIFLSRFGSFLRSLR